MAFIELEISYVSRPDPGHAFHYDRFLPPLNHQRTVIVNTSDIVKVYEHVIIGIGMVTCVDTKRERHLVKHSLQEMGEMLKARKSAA